MILKEDKDYNPICYLDNCNNLAQFRSWKFGYRPCCCRDHELESHKMKSWKEKKYQDTLAGLMRNKVDFHKVALKTHETIRSTPGLRESINKKLSEANLLGRRILGKDFSRL